MNRNQNRFANLAIEDFKKLAQDETLSKYERIGFPDSYRSGKEEAIFQDILTKLPVLNELKMNVLDVGLGCSELPEMLIKLCKEKSHLLTLIDSDEKLAHLHDSENIHKVAAHYPNCTDLISEFKGKVDVILCYSVLQYILIDVASFRFLDTTLSLLAPGGHFLIGDIPNIAKRKRFFAKETGTR